MNTKNPYNRIVLPGRVLVRMHAGEDPQNIPARRDVISGACSSEIALDGGGAVDKTLQRGGIPRIYRAFESAKNVMTIGHRHKEWNEDEIEIGLSRTFAVDLDTTCDTGEIADALNGLSTVESATPVYCSITPFNGPEQQMRDRPVVDESAEWDSVDHYHAFDMIGGTQALSFEPGDPTVIVAVIDSGVALSHVEFSQSGRLRSGFDMVDLTAARIGEDMELFGDFHGRDGNPEDQIGHGTACAGIIGARGLHIPPGLAGSSPILPMRAMASVRRNALDKPTAIGSSMDIDAAVKRAVDLGARVLNLSFGTSGAMLRPDDPVPHVEVVRYALARGCVLVAASGNAGNDIPYYPAALPGVIAVGSVGPDLRPSSFMSRGAHVAIGAPGERIPTPSLHGYTLNTGTSFAAPFVAAAAALILSRGLRYAAPLPVSTIKMILQAAADPFPVAANTLGCGQGLLNVPAALALLDAELRYARFDRKEEYACEKKTITV